MEIVPIILVASIGLLAIVLAIVGVQIIRILNECKKTVEKTNKIIDDAGRVSEHLAGPTSSLSGVFLGLKTGAKILQVLLARKKRKEHD